MTELVNELQCAISRLEELVASAQRHESALGSALDLHDDIGGLVAAVGLCQALVRAEAELARICACEPLLPSEALLEVRQATRGMCALLRLACTTLNQVDLRERTRARLDHACKSATSN